MLLFLGGVNPVYTAPADVKFADALVARDQAGRPLVPFSVHHGLYADETAGRCAWHIPDTHFLEMWSDLRAYDGTVSIVQPLMDPLYESSRSIHEIVNVLNQRVATGYDTVRDHYRRQQRALSDFDFDQFWQRSLNEGIIRGTAARPITVAVAPNFAAGLPAPAAPATGDALEIVFRRDPTVLDGRYANNGWLQELPKPLSKLTWDNAAIMSLETATRLNLSNEDVVELALGGDSVRAAVWIVPGHPNNVVTAHLGYGRPGAGQNGSNIGFNAYALRTTAGAAFCVRPPVRKTGDRYPLATTEYHHTLLPGQESIDSTHNREIVVYANIGDYDAKYGHGGRNSQTHGGGAEHGDNDATGAGDEDQAPDVEPSSPAETQPEEGQGPASLATEGHEEGEHPTLYPEYDYSEYNAWGMAIDLNTCIGCNACAIACQAENNIPIVGKREVQRGREMHWLRIDRYYKGDVDNPTTYFQP
jgi:molybdopterin-containing oxidoreductase family iron-sulfur binding subunit